MLLMKIKRILIIISILLILFVSGLILNVVQAINHFTIRYVNIVIYRRINSIIQYLIYARELLC